MDFQTTMILLLMMRALNERVCMWLAEAPVVRVSPASDYGGDVSCVCAPRVDLSLCSEAVTGFPCIAHFCCVARLSALCLCVPAVQ